MHLSQPRCQETRNQPQEESPERTQLHGGEIR